MDTFRSKLARWRRVGLVSAFGLGLTAVLITLLVNSALALRYINGAFGCGAFSASIAEVPEGYTVIPMVPERDSGGVVISKSIVVQGGWTYLPGGGDCAGLNANPHVTGTVGLRNAGFTFQAPDTRSALIWGQGESVLTLDIDNEPFAIEHMSLDNEPGYPTRGGGIDGVLDNGADVRFTNLRISNTQATNNGGGFYLEVRNGTHLRIEDSEFSDNQAQQGGGFEIHVYDDSHVTIHNTRFADNVASSGSGGAGRIIMHSGHLSITNGIFTNNTANSGSGGALSIEGTGGNGRVWILNSSFSGNSAGSGSNVSQTGSGLTVYNLSQSLYLPVIAKTSPPTFDYARITGITLDSNYNYQVKFETSGFTPQLPGQHLHFFFNTVSPDQAGVPGSGPWKIYGSSSPFTGYRDTDKPPFATEMCVLVANPNHSVQANSGNCYRLPVNVEP